MSKKRIVIVGGGFAGLAALREMSHVDAEITVIDTRSSQVFQPLLFLVATCGVSGDDVESPIRAFINGKRNIRFIQDEVTAINVQDKFVTTSQNGSVPFDYVLVTCGAQSNFFGMTDVAANAMGLKDTQEAIHIRNKILTQLERATLTEDEDERRRLLTFVVVGGGPTGVEVAGSMAELLFNGLGKYYPTLSKKDITLYLLEGMGNLLPQVKPKEQEKAKKWLESLGVTVCLHTMMSGYDGKTVTIKDKDSIDTEVVIWGAGVCASSLIKTLGLEQGHAGRLIVRPTLQVKDVDYVFTAGDTAHYEPSPGARPLPMTAAVAMQSGTAAGKNIVRLLNGQALENFSYTDKGTLCVVANGKAVGLIKGHSLAGWFCWFLWAGAHIWLPFASHIKWSLNWKFIWNHFSKTLPNRNQS